MNTKTVQSEENIPYEKPMTAHDTAEYLSISLSHLYKLTSKKKIPFHKPTGKLIFFYKSELEIWIKTSTQF